MVTEMKKRINIGIMGAAIDSDNLGCMALTYSLVGVLDAIEKDIQEYEFNYFIFDGTKNSEKYDLISERMSISKDKFHNCHMGYFYYKSLFSAIRILPNNIKFLKEISKCDCVIDVTGGDSFTDIYGDERFLYRTKMKQYLINRNIPLCLGPQTYGPFLKKRNENLARNVLQKADIVITRDLISKKLIKEISNRDVPCVPDLAFLLPYDRKGTVDSNRIKIGVNFSGLLTSNHTEQTEINFSLKTNYDLYIREICKELAESNSYEVHLISHVGSDYEIHKKVKEIYPQFVLVEQFMDPIEAKNYISKMDVFIGARMHGTIAAFTTGVACIPTAYSRKFQGLFSTYGYNRVVDLSRLDTLEAIELTKKYLHSYKVLQCETKESFGCAQNDLVEFKEILKNWIIAIFNKRMNV